MKTVQLKVDQEYVQGAGVVLGAKGSNLTTYIQVEFTEDWDALSKYVTTRDAKGLHPEVIVLTPLMLVPETERTYSFPVSGYAMGEEGLMSVTFTGYKVEDGNETTAVINTATAKLRVLPSDYSLMEDGSITPTIAQQLQAEIEEIKEDIAEAAHAKEYAESAEESAQAAAGSAQSADDMATLSRSYAKGDTNTREGEETDNAKHYSEQASNSADSASTSASDAADSATEAESWAKGGTNTREGEDTNNSEYFAGRAQYFAERAEQITGEHVEAFNGRTGQVAPEEGDYDISQITAEGAVEGQALTIDENGNIVASYPATASSHAIKDGSGTTMTQRTYLQFEGAEVEDDSSNNITRVEAQNIQKIVMPTASASLAGKLFQYIGNTGQNFTNGFYYRCVEVDGSYIWVQTDTQPRDSELVDIVEDLSQMVTENNSKALILDGDGGYFIDDGDYAILGNWRYKEV